MEKSALETLLSTPIETYGANNIGYQQMLRLMDINLSRRNTNSDNLGNGVISATNKVSDEVSVYDYSYTRDVNYLDNFQKNAKDNTTRVVIDDKVINKYYDDNDAGISNFISDAKINHYDEKKNKKENKKKNKEENKKKNSILYKTKKLFECKKINTIISRFHTDNGDNIYNDVSESARTKNYGLSHGRNLLTYKAEKNEGEHFYNVNGYNDPYCRVWTHHHQYSDLRARLIRPFSFEKEDKEGNKEIVVKETKNVNTWETFYLWRDMAVLFKEIEANGIRGVKSTKDNSWSWRKNGVENYDLSVLNNKHGIVNIAPKFQGGGAKNIHTKDCMFSIENLAWQGYDPYSFEQALSWEQRGPFGGRIMWFPPYGLRFNEDTSVQWNEHSFIGRGENVFTYTNTSRSGTLEFMMVVDHPSIIDYATWHNPDELKDTDILRYFAGCDGDEKGILQRFTKPTPLTDEYIDVNGHTGIAVVENTPPESESPVEVSSDEEIKLSFYVFYPNNYSGYYDNKPDRKVDPIAYLLYGKGAQWKCNVDDVTRSEVLPLGFNEVTENDEASYGKGYEMMESKSDVEKQNEENNFIIGTGKPNGFGKSKYIQNNNKRWYYRIDGKYENGITDNSVENCFGQYLPLDQPSRYQDTQSIHLNCDVEKVKELFNDNNENLYSLAEIAYALRNDIDTSEENKEQKKINENAGGGLSKDNERIKRLIELFDTRKTSPYQVIELHGTGYSNIHGSNSSEEVNKKRNEFLAIQRCKTALSWFLANYGHGSKTLKSGSESTAPSKPVSKEESLNESGVTAKQWRSAKIEIKIKKSAVKPTEDLNNETNDETTTQEQVFVRFNGFRDCKYKKNINGVEVELFENVNDDNDPQKKGRKWYYDKESSSMVLLEHKIEGRFNRDKDKNMIDNHKDENGLRYDQEYYFFKQLEAKHPDVFSSLKEKLQYFDPAFHSMTPEGFMGRLNFLQQCTRQGDTIGLSDRDGYSANNLAFGRPPFCILRLGDFYYQKIVIRNINISYDPLVLDLNQEGVGVVPLIANVTISFNFIGGGDLTGPVRRLQNAMSFNYYANGRLYDNRADRIEYKDVDFKTMGRNIDFTNSTFNHVPRSKH